MRQGQKGQGRQKAALRAAGIALGAALAVSPASHAECQMVAYTDAEGLIRVVRGCRAEPPAGGEVWAGSYYRAMLLRLAALFRIAAERGAMSVMPLPEDQSYNPRTDFCDRMWLWAEDEGPRAPEMTRHAKIAQACNSR